MIRLLVAGFVVSMSGAFAAIEIPVRGAVSVIACTWHRWQVRRHDKYWGLGAYYTDDEDCFEWTADDLAELDRIGISWGQQ